MLAIGIPLMIFAYALASLLWDFYRDNLERELQSKAHLVAEICAPVLSPNSPDDPGALARLVDQWRIHTDVRVSIANSDGIIAAASSPEDVGLPVNDARRPGLLAALKGRSNSTIWKNPQYGNQDTMYVNIPVHEGGRIVGAVRVAYTLTQIQQKIERIRSALLLSVSVYAVLIIVLTFWLASSIARPVEALTRDAQRLGAGDLAHRVNVKGTEEINQLAMTLNHMTQRLQHLEGLRRQFVSNVSHELRTPLASIRGMTETLIQHGESDPSLGKRYLPRIVAQTDRLARLATQLLDLTLIESGNTANFFSQVALSSVAEEALQTCSDKAAEQDIELWVDVPTDLPELTGDRDRLVQLFLNLVDNAIRYTPHGGRVTVRARTDGEGISVYIEDTGPGIPPEHLPHVFDRFYRVEQARTMKSGGTGLGLSIAQQIVHAHGGRINVESEPGNGTRFHFWLPLCPPSSLEG